jgi:hypothetical protein
MRLNHRAAPQSGSTSRHSHNLNQDEAEPPKDLEYQLIDNKAAVKSEFLALTFTIIIRE